MSRKIHCKKCVIILYQHFFQQSTLFSVGPSPNNLFMNIYRKSVVLFESFQWKSKFAISWAKIGRKNENEWLALIPHLWYIHTLLNLTQLVEISGGSRIWLHGRAWTLTTGEGVGLEGGGVVESHWKCWRLKYMSFFANCVCISIKIRWTLVKMTRERSERNKLYLPCNRY